MGKKLHERRERDDMQLALLRTSLANRRTLLTYCNASIAMCLTGVGFLKLMEHAVYTALGSVLLVLSPLTLGLGLYDFFLTRKLIQKEKEDARV
ncbi:DUF202 domain-containing protein [Rubritalea tangerina]|uniref:DUF202 domain-containing protein n=2 Tax=Rubritalea tangerina TaxID=430798 RepID=A0ABW4ZE79_9BACT